MKLGSDSFYTAQDRRHGNHAFIDSGRCVWSNITPLSRSVLIHDYAIVADDRRWEGKGQTERIGSLADLLSALNLQIVDAEQGGFITAICARVDPGGDVTFANAGHLHPYCNGDEIALEAALPLGITAAAVYSETRIHTAPGDTLTFMSDGVVEACNATGELFGFERTREISRHSAAQIAQAAQSFGQQDDITVLTLAFTPAAALNA